MTERDKIRTFVIEHYIRPARAQGRTCVSVIVRDVDRQLTQNGNFKNICETLRKTKFHMDAKVLLREEIRRDSVRLNSSTNIFVFDW